MVDPGLALQVLRHGQMRSCFNRLHRQWFLAIIRLQGFKHSNLIHFRCGTSVAVEELAMDIGGPDLGVDSVDVGVEGGILIRSCSRHKMKLA